jgi:hypothetical protein
MRAFDMLGQSQVGVEQHACRVGAGDAPSGQVWVVDRDRSRPHDHGVADGAQAMQVQQVLGAIDEA